MIESTGREMAKTLRKMAKEIELLRSTNSSRLELSEKIQETISVIKEDSLDVENHLDEIDEENLDKLLNDIKDDDKNESTHF